MAICNGQARWAFDLSNWRPSKNDLLLATACIQPEEKERLAKFFFRNDFDASLIGRLLMRKFVRDTLPARQYNEIHFNRDDRGRPQLSGAATLVGESIDFNVSHQGNYSVLAGCAGAESHGTRVGVDVMKIEYTGGKPLHEFFRLMHRNFSGAEWDFIKSTNDKLDQTRRFMRTWCLKECYVKNVGVGITIDLQSISFAVQNRKLSVGSPVVNTQLAVNGIPVENWIFEESLLDDEHSVAVAVHYAEHNRPESAQPFVQLRFDDLMKDAIPLLEFDEDYCNKILQKEYKK